MREDKILPFYIADSELGFGAFANREIRKGEHIYTFTGEPVTYEESLNLGAEECYALQIGARNYIQLEAPGKFINHSCEPNAGLMAGFELMAIRDIHFNEQIVYDYSTTMLERHWEMRCKCGSFSCRHIIRDFDLLPETLQKEYIQLRIVQPFILQALQPKPHQIKG